MTNSVINLGAYGKLILPVQVDGDRWFYYWDVNGDGQATAADKTTHIYLDSLFKQNADGTFNPGSFTTNTYRYASLNGELVALPTMGQASFSVSNFASQTSVSGAALNNTYDDYLAIYDGYSLPTGWVGPHFWTSSPYGTSPTTLGLSDGYKGAGSGALNFNVALEYLGSPAVSFATTSGSANEGNSGNQTVNVTANLSSAKWAAVTVPITYSGTATSGTDYSAATTSLTIAAGDTSGTASFSVIGDSTVESNETVVLTMGKPTGATLGANTSYTHTITNDEVTVSFAAITGSANEGNSGNQTVNVTANLNIATTAAVTVPITYGGTATSGSDYSAATTSITIAAGDTSGTASFSVIGDSTIESNETVVLTMGTPTGATLGANTSYTYTITNDEAIDLGAYGKLILPVQVDGDRRFYYWDVNGDGQATEADKTTHIYLDSLFKQSADGAFNTGSYTTNTYRYTTLNGERVALPTMGQASFSVTDRANQTSVSGAALNNAYDDYLAIYDGYSLPTGWVGPHFWTSSPYGTSPTTLGLSDGYKGAGSGALNFNVALEYLGSIPSVSFAATTGSTNEGDSGHQTFNVTANLSSATTEAVTVPITYSGTATSGSDYSFATTSITIAAGDTSGTASFSVVGDSTVESDETVVLTMGTPTGARLGANTSYTHSITNDDVASISFTPQVSVSVVDAVVNENDSSNLTYTFTRTGDLSASLTANFFVNGTAGNSDYSSSSNLTMPTKSWTKLLGSSSQDVAHALTTGLDGSVYVSGYTKGSLDDLTNSGGLSDAFITKYLPDGSKSWTKLLGTNAYDVAHALTTGLDGSVYVSGYTMGNLDGQTKSGDYDAFITKYQSDGTKSWTKLLGTWGYDDSRALTTGLDGSIYVSGVTQSNLDGQTHSGGWFDAFITRYLSDGTEIWTKLFGSSSDEYAQALTTGLDGSVYVSGYTKGSLDGQIYSGGVFDAFITKYSSDGTKSWTNLLGTNTYDVAHSITTGLDGSVYVSGGTEGNLDGLTNNGGGADAFITKYFSDGTKSWTKLLGSSSYDFAQALTTGIDGSIYVSGYTYGNLDGQTHNNGGADTFITKYLSDGTKSWTKLLGSVADAPANALTTGLDGSIYVSGYTNGSLDGQIYSGGLSDAFITKYQVTPQITFAIGSATATLTIDPTADASTEGSETVVVNILSGAGYAAGTTASATGTIQDTPTYQITPSASSVNEGGLVTFNLATTNVAQGTSLSYTLSGVQANDIQGGSLTGSVTVDAQGNASIPVSLIADQTTEGAETFTVTLQGETASTIVNDSSKTEVSVSVADVVVNESGSSNLTYTFTRTGDLSSSLTANFSVNGTAGNSDYSSLLNLTMPTKSWTKLQGTNSEDSIYALTTGLDGSIYVSGETFGAIDGQANSGDRDAFLTNYSADGTKVWTKLLGSGNMDRANALTTGLDGSIYVSGLTDGAFDGQANSGGRDAFLTKYSADGTKAWTKLLGTINYEEATALTTGLDGSIYISGITSGVLDGQTYNGGNYDAFLTKYSADGIKAWTRLQGSSGSDNARALTTGLDGAIYVSGYTTGAQVGPTYNDFSTEAFLTKYSADGTKAWTKKLQGASTYDYVYVSGMTVGLDGAIYVSGSTFGELDGQTYSGGNGDAFLTKYSADGTKAWTKLLGSSSVDVARALTTGLDGSIYVSGCTWGELDGQANSGGNGDAFLTKYSADGTKAWTKLLGSIGTDVAIALTTGLDGTIYVGGLACGALDGQTYRGGGSDGFITKYQVLPQITFAAGSATATLTIDPTADANFEGDETVVVTLAQGSGYELGASSVATGTITDPPTYSISSSSESVNEGSAVTFTVATTNVANGTVLNYNLGGTGITSADIVGAALTGTATVNNNQASFTVNLVSDNTTEGSETLTATIQGQIGSVLVNDTSIAPLVSVSAVSPVLMEENASGSMQFEFVREGDLTQALTVGFELGGTASRPGVTGADYAVLGATGVVSNGRGSVVFAAGSNKASIRVDPTSDYNIEGNETVSVSLLAGTGYTPAQSGSSATVTIVNDDYATGTRPTYALEPMALTANEGSTVSYIINTTNVAEGTQLRYTLSGITQADLVAGGTLTGQVTVGANGKAQLNVQLANDELTETRAETLVASFSTMASTTTVLRTAGVLVNDSSKAPEVSVQLLGTGTVSEDGGQTLIYEVSRSSGNAALRVGYSLSGTASALTDYTKNITTTVIEFAAGETTKQLIVSPRADTTIESYESVTLTLRSGTGYSLKSGQSAATGTISNDDYAPVYRIEALPAGVEEGQAVRYVLDTDHVATGTVVGYTLSGVSVADLVGAGGVAPSLTGTVLVGADGKAILDVMLKADELTEAVPETLQASFKVGTGVVATAAGVGIEDTSQNVEVNVNLLGASSVYENDSSQVVFEFNRTGEALGALSVGYSLGGTARAGSDFTGSGTSGTVTFAAGSETAQLRLTLTNDQLIEADETLSLTLRTGTGYLLGEYATSELIVKNDDFRGTDRSEQINGDEAVNYLQGLGGVDRLYGRGGDDTLAGGSGKDLLYGGEGADTFYFDLAGRTNTDKIMDFDGTVDKIMLDSQLFAGLDANNDGVVDTSAFSQTGSAVGTQAQILYSASSGKLSYDADGTGAQQAQEFATLTVNTSIWHDDILLKAA